MLPRHKETLVPLFGKDGLTAQDLVYAFHPAVGTFSFADVVMRPDKKPDPMTGKHHKPRRVGKSSEADRGHPEWTYTQVAEIYDECEKNGTPLREECIRRINRDRITMEVLREIVAAPDVFVKKDRRVEVKSKETSALDAEIDRIRGDED